MKAKTHVSYFPVTPSEQAVLARLRDPDLHDRVDDLVDMLGLIAEARLRAADLEQAIQLLVASRQREGLDARFENLEARLRERIERGLVEIEGRLSRRIGDAPPTDAPAPDAPPPAPPVAPPTQELPEDARVAFRVGPELVWGPSAAQFYVAVWRWLFEHGHVTVADLPVPSGKARYAAATTPVHPSGKPFVRSEQPVPGVHVEVNLSRGDIIRRAEKYLRERGVVFEVVLGADG